MLDILATVQMNTIVIFEKSVQMSSVQSNTPVQENCSFEYGGGFLLTRRKLIHQ
jgi:hypothetical protein